MAKRAEYVHTGFGRWKWVDRSSAIGVAER